MSSDLDSASGDQQGWEAEARARWGETDAYKESSRRTRDYTPEQWEAIQAEMEAIEARFAELLQSGAAPDSPEAMDAAESARRHIHRRYYPCSHAMHAGLAEMYTADPRFRAHYEERAEGLARFVADAIRANLARAEP
ncbi:MAG TPA: TipAS antibiotic-recognition domain-containing protein [Longimicrobiales bacterium]|nr:TipAS antibiotic-recognition domain-containing protein [Longimicrobiales bacterium]